MKTENKPDVYRELLDAAKDVADFLLLHKGCSAWSDASVIQANKVYAIIAKAEGRGNHD